MDILSLTPGVRTIEMLHPADDSVMLGVRIKLRSLNDPELKNLKRSFTDEYLRKQKTNKVQKAEEIEANTDKLFVKAIIGWEWYNPTGPEMITDENGDEVPNPDYDASKAPHLDGDYNPPCNEINRKKFVQNEVMRSQITEETEDTKAFFTL